MVEEYYAMAFDLDNEALVSGPYGTYEEADEARYDRPNMFVVKRVSE